MYTGKEWVFILPFELWGRSGVSGFLYEFSVYESQTGDIRMWCWWRYCPKTDKKLQVLKYLPTIIVPAYL